MSTAASNATMEMDLALKPSGPRPYLQIRKSGYYDLTRSDSDATRTPSSDEGKASQDASPANTRAEDLDYDVDEMVTMVAADGEEQRGPPDYAYVRMLVDRYGKAAINGNADAIKEELLQVCVRLQDEVSDEIKEGPRWSLGSSLHSLGLCRPCAWVWKARGCRDGRNCDFCHLCDAGAMKARRKAKAAMTKAGLRQSQCLDMDANSELQSPHLIGQANNSLESSQEVTSTTPPMQKPCVNMFSSSYAAGQQPPSPTAQTSANRPWISQTSPFMGLPPGGMMAAVRPPPGLCFGPRSETASPHSRQSNGHHIPMGGTPDAHSPAGFFRPHAPNLPQAVAEPARLSAPPGLEQPSSLNTCALFQQRPGPAPGGQVSPIVGVQASPVLSPSGAQLRTWQQAELAQALDQVCRLVAARESAITGAQPEVTQDFFSSVHCHVGRGAAASPKEDVHLSGMCVSL